MDGDLGKTGVFFIICIVWLIYMILILRKIYIYYHPPEKLGNLYGFCDFSLRKKQFIGVFVMLLLFSLFQHIHVFRMEYVLLDIVALILLFYSFLKDRIYENGISYNDIYIFADEINEIIYEKSRGEYWIKTKFPTPARIYVRLGEEKGWPENLLHLMQAEVKGGFR